MEGSITSYVDFRSLCKQTQKQVVAQSRGLLEVTLEEDWNKGICLRGNSGESIEDLGTEVRDEDGYAVRVWALPWSDVGLSRLPRDSDRSHVVSSRSRGHLNTAGLDLIQYQLTRVNWLHRSVHDLLWGDGADDLTKRPYKLQPDSDVILKFLNGTLKLLVALPTFHNSKKELPGGENRLRAGIGSVRESIWCLLQCAERALPSCGDSVTQILDQLRTIAPHFHHGEVVRLGGSTSLDSTSILVKLSLEEPTEHEHMAVLRDLIPRGMFSESEFWVLCAEWRLWGYIFDSFEKTEHDRSDSWLLSRLFSQLCYHVDTSIQMRNGMSRSLETPMLLCCEILERLKQVWQHTDNASRGHARPLLCVGERKWECSSRRGLWDEHMTTSWRSKVDAGNWLEMLLERQVVETLGLAQFPLGGVETIEDEEERSRAESLRYDIMLSCEKLLTGWDSATSAPRRLPNGRVVLLLLPNRYGSYMANVDMGYNSSEEGSEGLEIDGDEEGDESEAGVESEGCHQFDEVEVFNLLCKAKKGGCHPFETGRLFESEDNGPGYTAVYSIRQTLGPRLRATVANWDVTYSEHALWLDEFIDALIADVWANHDQQLTAWEQLFVLACIRHPNLFDACLKTPDKTSPYYYVEGESSGEWRKEVRERLLGMDEDERDRHLVALEPQYDDLSSYEVKMREETFQNSRRYAVNKSYVNHGS